MTREARWGNAMRYIADQRGIGSGGRIPARPGSRADTAGQANWIARLSLPTQSRPTPRSELASAHQAISGEDPALVALLPAFVQILQSEDAKEARRRNTPPRIPRTVKPQQRATPKAEGHAYDQPSRESGSWARYCDVRFEWMGERSTCSNVSDAPDPRDVGHGSGRDCGR